MNEKEYAQAIAQPLEALGKTVEDLERALFSPNKRLMNETKKNLPRQASRRASPCSKK